MNPNGLQFPHSHEILVRIGEVCERFEKEWQTGRPPSIEDYLTDWTQSERVTLLEELILIDLEYGWRTQIRQFRADENQAAVSDVASASSSPAQNIGHPSSLEDYIARFPELGTLNTLSPRLVVQEYRVRHLWGDRPAREQFCQRMGRIDLAVDAALDVVDAELRDRVDTPTADLSSNVATPVSSDTLDQKDEQIPDHIGRYAVKSRLGRGGFGVVYLALDEDLDQLVAIKVPRLDRIERSDTAEKFLQEARAAARIREHPGIVTVYDCGRQSNDVPYVVMEYVEGQSLKALLDGERLSHNRAVELASHIARAVHAAHKEGFVHRDLKPSNVLIHPDGLPRVTDFGLALHESVQQLHSDEFTGTVPYMSPEQVLGESQRLDGRTDIWSVGVMLYEMLTGRLPFRGETLEQVSDEILYRDPKPPRQIDDTIPSELERICLKCMAKRIDERYTSAIDLADDLEKWRTSAAVQVVGAVDSVVGSVTDAPPVTEHHRRWPIVSIFVLASILLVILVAWLSSHMIDRTPPTAGPLSVTFDIIVSDLHDKGRRNVPLSDARARPLRAGDLIRIEAQFNRPIYAYLVWINGEGIASPAYPWNGGKWSDRSFNEQMVETLRLPPENDWPMRGTQGMETLMILARDKPLPADVNMRTLFADLPAIPLKDAQSIVWFRNGQPITLREDRTRAPIFYETVKLDDPLLRMQADLHERLKKYFLLNEAVSFANAGE